MNYLAHAWQLIREGDDDPYALAGVAVPDWLGVAARRTKCRTHHAAPHARSDDPRLAALARGICRHHADDAWFHDAPEFGRLSLAFAKRIRETLGETTSMRPWFLGHILVELLLDDELARREPTLLDRYYAGFEGIDAGWVAARVAEMAGRDVGRLAEFVERFAEVQFLRDYREDDRLTFRLNQVMARVGLAELPGSFVTLLPACRDAVAASFAGLIDRETAERIETAAARSA